LLLLLQPVPPPPMLPWEPNSGNAFMLKDESEPDDARLLPELTCASAEMEHDKRSHTLQGSIAD
jgi:hypothetical protein